MSRSENRIQRFSALKLSLIPEQVPTRKREIYRVQKVYLYIFFSSYQEDTIYYHVRNVLTNRHPPLALHRCAESRGRYTQLVIND